MFKPETVAQLLLINLSRFSEEKKKEHSRIRISKKGLKKASGRVLIRDAFVEALKEEFFALGWHFGEHTDTEYYLLEQSKIDSWGTAACTRVNKEIKKLRECADYAGEIERIFIEECGPSLIDSQDDD